jgi:hypothetical protein
MKKLAMASMLCLAAGAAQAALQPGDLAFTAFNADEDGFAVVALRDLPQFQAIYFTDNEWSGGAPGTGQFNTGENTFVWVTGAHTIAAGTVVRFSQIDKAARSASIGAFALFQSGAPGFSASGDTLFAFTGDGSGVPDRLLAAVSSENYAGSSLADSGLQAGVHAVIVGAGADFAEYAGARTGLPSFADYRTTINDGSAWQSYATGDFATTIPNLGSFAVAPVPEPSSYALLAAGLGMIGWRLRRRAHQRAPKPLPAWVPTAAGG